MRDERLVLVDAEDARGGRVTPVREPDFATLAEDVAFVRPFDPGQDPNEGGLAGAVLAGDGGHVTSLESEK